jgi:MFS family permease
MLARFGLDARHAGELLALMGIIMVGMQGGAIGRLAKRYGELRLIIAGFLICGLGLVCFGVSPTMALVVASLSVLSLGHGMLHPSLSSLASLGASPERRGATMGVFQSAGSLARVLGPPAAGLVYDAVSPQAPFFMGSALLVVGFAVATAGAKRTEAVIASRT